MPASVLALLLVTTLVGGIGLVAAVPVTTGLAALLAERLSKTKTGRVRG